MNTNNTKTKLLISSIISLAIGFGISQATNYFLENKEKMAMDHSNMNNANTEEKMHSHNETHLHVKANFPEPKVKLEAFKDTMGGYNIKVGTENFKWVPEKAGQSVEAYIPTEGHAHVFVNNKKVGRLYGEWMYLKGENFQKGENKIVVTLNGNNHMDWYSTDDTRQIKAETSVIVE